MKLASPARSTTKKGLVAAAGALALLAVGATLRAQSSEDFLPQFTIIELMDSIVMPQAQIVWDAVVYNVTADGESVTGPETDEDWQTLRWSAVALAESANNLLVPGRTANKPGAVAGEGELEPAQIDALIKEQHGAWVAHAQVLYQAAMDAVNAIDARDADKLSDAGGTIDSACESCHLQFWYPEQ
jgi:cytochrome c556